MRVVLIIVILICLVIFGFLATNRRTPISDDSVNDFNKHLDALSPETRKFKMEPTKKIELEDSSDGT
ncbi:hypothetical protein LBMAG12_03160 [Actinomycetes bacterium]|nr:hypothetical protein LBMAG12_03160 [Actinomycetes bacterium]